jgi:MarR family transcriptional regulator, lower aerobic nicotinate degradation pathway regulator
MDQLFANLRGAGMSSSQPTPSDHSPDHDPPNRLRRLPSWLAAQVARKAERLVVEALAHEGVRRQHFAVLSSLAEQGAASQATLGRRLWIDRSDLHALLGELESGGLVARVRDERDRRRNVVRLTPRGRAALKRLEKRIDAAQKELLRPLSARERRELVDLLERLID